MRNSTGPGFDSLVFSIYDQAHGQLLFEKTFNSSTLDQEFFDDKILDLGLLTSITGYDSFLNLSFDYSLVAANSSGFDFNFIVGNAKCSPTPLPGTVVLLGSGLVVLIFLKRKFVG